VRTLFARIDIAWRAERLKSRTDIELYLLPALVARGSLALDIGANKGVYSYHLQKLARVAAFEPMPMLAEKLIRAGFAGMQVHNCGLGREAGFFDLHVPAHAKRKHKLNTPAASFRTHSDIAGDHFECFSVEVKRLDDFRFADVSFAKLDVEGWEEHVLTGGEDTVARNRPVILIEIVERIAPGIFEFLAGFMDRHGYTTHFVSHGENHLSTLAMLNRDTPQAYNFLMFPRERETALAAACNSVLAAQR
jgi:FkbM family methyltransferase